MDVVLALSPQFEIDKAYDQRWEAIAKTIDFRYRIDSSAIADSCKYFVAYDPGTEDIRHVEKLREVISAARLVEIQTPFSGHPSAYYLAETNLIKDLAISVLKNGTVEHITVGTHRKRSKTYLYELSKRLARKHKYRSALIAIDKAIAIDANAPALHLHRSEVLNGLGQADAALVAIDKAITLDGDAPALHLHRSVVLSHLAQSEAALVAVDNAIKIDSDTPAFHLQRSVVLDSLGQPEAALTAAYETRRKLNNDAHLIGALSDRLAKHGDYAGALVLIEKAISIDDSVLQFHLHRCAVCRALGDIPAAISAGEVALKLAPENASLLARLSRLHAAQGGLAHWARSAVLAKKAIFSLFS
jgi:tetratricopeptide (TPR) repeat protein